MIQDLETIKTVLVKDFNYFINRRKIPLGGKSRLARQFLTNLTGAEWRSARAVLTPTFTSGKLRQMVELMDESAHKMLKSLNDDIKASRGEVNIKDRVGVYSMDVIASCCFSTSVNSQDPHDPFVNHAKMLFNRNLSLIVIAMVWFPKLIELFELSVFPVECLTYFETVIHKVVNYRRSQNKRRNDFLQLLLDAQDRETEGKLLDEHENEHTTKQKSVQDNSFESWKKHKVLDENGLVANSILFLLAGYETTATTISYVIYLLALNQDCQQKLKDEIDEALNKHGKLSPEVILSLTYLEMVISETLRIYPPTVRLERQCTNDYKLGDIFIPKGTLVAAGVYSVHHDPEIYPEPQKFIPERFTQENKANRHPMAYIPFGAGPRVCIGMRFALMEAKICIAHLINQFEVSPCAKTEIPIVMRKGFRMLLPQNGITVKIQPRK
ncbi:hypothetical protein CHUAL_006738 [Chamberlinius hualienensis]